MLEIRESIKSRWRASVSVVNNNSDKLVYAGYGWAQFTSCLPTIEQPSGGKSKFPTTPSLPGNSPKSRLVKFAVFFSTQNYDKPVELITIFYCKDSILYVPIKCGMIMRVKSLAGVWCGIDRQKKNKNHLRTKRPILKRR